ncbi:hypothetical protein CEXT_197361 [Caerostris extrusa]|uniref:Uncharacterized protein n=1 Tax=Caerostris extrusa TaxID=172846 RepID=A0AAV4MZ58_CAEEX|nr:hypothetical protein CEXT_197361 [Caerostris extrusa]
MKQRDANLTRRRHFVSSARPRVLMSTQMHRADIVSLTVSTLDWLRGETISGRRDSSVPSSGLGLSD